MNTAPDGFLGAVLAAEGVPGMKALINGPGGCRSRAQTLVHELVREYAGEEPACCQSKYFSRQSRLPCTYLNADDIVLGAGTKIADGLRSVLSVTEDDVVLIDTLGASVQVTDRAAAATRSGRPERVVLAADDLSLLSCGQGFDDTMQRIIAHLAPARSAPGDGLTVNLLGGSLADRSWEFVRAEAARLLAPLGVRIAAAPGLSSPRAELAASGQAALNIVLRPEWAAATAAWYERELGIPALVPSRGAPIGYPAIRAFLTETAQALGRDPAPALAAVAAEEAALRRLLQNCDKTAAELHGAGAAFTGRPSDLLPLIRWLYEWFGLVPQRVRLTEGADTAPAAALRAYLTELDCDGAWTAESLVGCRAVFTDGLTAAALRAEHPTLACIPIGLPYAERASFVDRGLLGLSGCRNLADALINGQAVFRCGQPTLADFR